MTKDVSYLMLENSLRTATSGVNENLDLMDPFGLEQPY